MAQHRTYRIAVVGGCGTWGRHYLHACAKHPDCDIVALVDRAKDRRRAFAEHYGIRTEYDSVEDLLARDVPDIVSNILPVGQNLTAVTACAEAGVKVVSCEKPIAVSLAEADEMVRVCRERGALLGCGTACWEVPHLLETVAWVREGHIGRLTGAAIPGGLPREVSGAGCVLLVKMRVLTGMEVAWVEGWSLLPVSGFAAAEATSAAEVDSPAYGRLGLSGGIVCEIPPPRPAQCAVYVGGENGQVWLGGPRSVLIQGNGPESSPVYPGFLLADEKKDFFTRVIERLMRAFDTGEMICSGHDYRQALEIAIALKQSAHHRNHGRVSLPLEDRSLKIYPHPYRLAGGDVAGWGSIGYTGPPDLPV